MLYFTDAIILMCDKMLMSGLLGEQTRAIQTDPQHSNGLMLGTHEISRMHGLG